MASRSLNSRPAVPVRAILILIPDSDSLNHVGVNHVMDNDNEERYLASPRHSLI
jgi:hypothetical protein